MEIQVLVQSVTVPANDCVDVEVPYVVDDGDLGVPYPRMSVPAGLIWQGGSQPGVVRVRHRVCNITDSALTYPGPIVVRTFRR